GAPVKYDDRSPQPLEMMEKQNHRKQKQKHTPPNQHNEPPTPPPPPPPPPILTTDSGTTTNFEAQGWNAAEAEGQINAPGLPGTTVNFEAESPAVTFVPEWQSLDASQIGVTTAFAPGPDGHASTPEATAPKPDRGLLAGYGENDLSIQNIHVGSGTVTVRGSGVPAGHTVWVAGHEVPVDPKGDFVAEEILPSGTHTVEVAVLDADGNGSLYL